MTSRPPRFAAAILDRFLPDNDPLAGDLLEAAAHRSRAWLFAQVALAVLLRSAAEIQTHKRMTAEAVLVASAMIFLLGFYAVVVASLVNHLLVLNDIAWVTTTGRYAPWQLLSTIPSFALAVGAGRVIGRFHREHRIAAIVAFAATAAAAAFLNLYLFVPDVLLRPFVPYAAWQSAVGAVFIAGLFVGIRPARHDSHSSLGTPATLLGPTRR